MIRSRTKIIEILLIFLYFVSVRFGLVSFNLNFDPHSRFYHLKPVLLSFLIFRIKLPKTINKILCKLFNQIFTQKIKIFHKIRQNKIGIFNWSKTVISTVFFLWEEIKQTFSLFLFVCSKITNIIKTIGFKVEVEKIKKLRN